MDLDRYSRRAEAFNSLLAREYYRHFAGLNGGFDQAGAYQRHAELFSAQTIDALRARAGDGGPLARRAAALLRFAVEGSMGTVTRELDAELARLEATVSVQVAGGRFDRGVDRLGLGEALAALATEPDPRRRSELDRARRNALASTIAPLAFEALQQRHAHAQSLGWSSYADLCSELAGVDLAELDGQAQRFLLATGEIYAHALERAAHDVLGVGADELRRCDLPRLLRRPGDEAAFPRGRLLPVVNGTLRDLGLALHPNIVLDVEPRTGKSMRAFCVPVRIPHEIYLVLSPVGGRADFRTLLHETGHAQHFAGSDPALPFELRRLGDPAVGEAFAFLFEGLVDQPAWRQRQLGLETDTDTRAHAGAQRLLLLRRYAAKLSYERELHSDARAGPERLSAAYAHTLSSALSVPWPTESWLSDVDPGMYVVSYLRGWALESGLRRGLSRRFGPDWFAQPQAGELLSGLWQEGQRLSAEEVLARVNPGARLDFAALADDMGA